MLNLNLIDFKTIDFSKVCNISVTSSCRSSDAGSPQLDRENVELSARPVPVDLRKMVENLARITETRGSSPDQPGVDVIVSVTDDVPSSVYLDETYTFRVSTIQPSQLTPPNNTVPDFDERESCFLRRKSIFLKLSLAVIQRPKIL